MQNFKSDVQNVLKPNNNILNQRRISDNIDKNIKELQDYLSLHSSQNNSNNSNSNNNNNNSNSNNNNSNNPTYRSNIRVAPNSPQNSSLARHKS